MAADRKRSVPVHGDRRSLNSAITNPLEAEIRHAIYAADLLMGHDAYAANLIQAFRSERKRQQASS